MNDVKSGELASWLRGVGVLHAGLASAFLLLWIGMAIRGDFWRSDFTAFYLGWRIVLEGHGDRLYDRETQEEYQAYYVPERTAEGGLLAFVNPPHAAVAMSPFGALPRNVAFYGWAISQLGILALVLAFFAEWAAAWPVPERVLLLVTVLAFPPLFMSFQLGQISLAALLCLAGFYRSLQKDEDIRAAAWLVLGTFKPQLMMIPAVTLLAGRRWRAIGWSVAFFSLCAGLATASLGWRCWLDFLEITRHNAQQFGTDGIFPLCMYNAKGMLTAVLGSEQAMLINSVTAAALLLTMIVTTWIWRGPWHPESADFFRKAALSLQLGFLCNPHFNPADAVCLVLPALFFLLYLRRSGRPWHGWAFFLLTWPWLFAADAYVLPHGLGQVRPFFLVMGGALVWMGSIKARPLAA